MSRSVSFVAVQAIAFVFSLSGSALQAGAITYVTPSGAKAGEDNAYVKASATFSLQDNHHLLITLTNLFQNPTSSLQTLGGLSFDVSDASGSGKLITKNSGQLSTISKGGSYTAGVSDPLLNWTATLKGSHIDLTTIGNGKSTQLIIGPDSNGLFDPSLHGLYSNANSSIIQQDPNVLGTATFDITVAGLTSASLLSNVQFHFGRDDTEGFVIGQLSNGGSGSGGSVAPSFGPAAVPEPSSFALLGFGAIGLLVRARYCRAKK